MMGLDDVWKEIEHVSKQEDKVATSIEKGRKEMTKSGGT